MGYAPNMEHQPRAIVRSGEDIGRAIGTLRRIRGLTQEALARRVGMRRVYLSQIESGRTTSLLDHELRVLRELGAEVFISWPDDNA